MKIQSKDYRANIFMFFFVDMEVCLQRMYVMYEEGRSDLLSRMANVTQ